MDIASIKRAGNYGHTALPSRRFESNWRTIDR